MCLAFLFLAVYGLLYGTGAWNPGVIHFFALNFGCAVPLAVVIFCAARYRSWISAFLSLPWIVYLGDISYSIYAVHTWTLRPFIRPPIDFNSIYAVDAALRITLAMAFTVIVATATYSIIEVPCRRFLRTRLMDKRPDRLGDRFSASGIGLRGNERDAVSLVEK
jgi:peptidoglycan/LPS O-acetylase OafA/YrhL